LGVLAFGDSITNGGGELQWGVALQSWALWVARGLALPFTCYAVDGARVGDVVERQVPAFSRLVGAESRFQVGCLYIGVNDVRSPDWDPVAFEAGFRRALGFVAGRCELVLTVTAPLDLGRPRAAGKVQELDAVIERVAGEAGAIVLDLRDWGARNLVMTDHVHPTAFGQIDIAERALEALSGAGMRMEVGPSSLIFYDTTWRRRLRADVTYSYRHAKVSARSGWVRARVAVRGSRL
jgi:lysophospholipase L1-like esterase